jgi:lipoprotein-releasing system ATP-binding protein
MKSSSAIQGEALRREFVLSRGDAALRVLRDVSIAIGQGEFLAIVGPSGSGKSTLLHLLGGLDRPTSGRVIWNDVDISTMRDEPLARLRCEHIGFVFQFHHLLPEFTAFENIALAAMIGGKRRGEAGNIANRLLERFGLISRSSHRPSELSGGEQQRVAIARALANSPKVLLADEPSGNLDSGNSSLLHAALRDLNKNDGQTIVLVTHNESLTAGADRIMKMVDGTLSPVV